MTQFTVNSDREHGGNDDQRWLVVCMLLPSINPHQSYHTDIDFFYRTRIDFHKLGWELINCHGSS